MYLLVVSAAIWQLVQIFLYLVLVAIVLSD